MEKNPGETLHGEFQPTMSSLVFRGFDLLTRPAGPKVGCYLPEEISSLPCWVIKGCYCSWIPNNHRLDVKNPVNHGINYQPQLVQDLFHQQYAPQLFKVYCLQTYSGIRGWWVVDDLLIRHWGEKWYCWGAFKFPYSKIFVDNKGHAVGECCDSEPTATTTTTTTWINMTDLNKLLVERVVQWEMSNPQKWCFFVAGSKIYLNQCGLFEEQIFFQYL